MKTYEQKKYKRKQTLSQYLYNRIREYQNTPEVRRNKAMSWPDGFYFRSEDIEFWIQQYKIKEGRSEWSETYKRNFWVEDEVQMAPSSADIV